MASWEFTTMESTRNYEQIHCIENILIEVVKIQCIKYILIHFQQQANAETSNTIRTKFGNDLTDRQKIELFLEINELGTKMSDEHIAKIKKEYL